MRGIPSVLTASLSIPAALLLSISLFLLSCLSAGAAASGENADRTKIPPPSSTAQRLYSRAQSDLLQIRILLKNGRAQTAVGSGFLVGTGNLVITNYHVVSRLALEPETYTGEYVDTKSQRGPLELLAVDALHDLAIVRVNRKGTGFFRMPEQPMPLRQGQYLYSLGNPLDLGFAISEGSYNGVIRRGFYDQLMFTGPINAGMSGGPAITADGRVAGVNVSKRLDGELVSFLVPIRYARELLIAAASVQKPPKDFRETVGRQLLMHQTVMTEQLLAAPFTVKTLGKYLVPVRESDQMRCWGQSTDKPENMYSVEQVRCAMESAVFVSDELMTGRVSMSHVFTRSNKLGPLRFSQLTAAAFKNEKFGSRKSRQLTGPACEEQFLVNGNLAMRAVLCVRAYRKFSGLYDFSVLTASTNEDLAELQSRLDLRGVSYENGLRFSRRFLESLDREKKP